HLVDSRPVYPTEIPSADSSSPAFVLHDQSTRRREPVETTIQPDDLRAMSPRMTSEDVEALEREMHTELRRHAKALQDSLLLIFNRVEAVKKGHEKLDSSNKLLQKCIGDLTSMR
ncbi:hypothetical protein BGZ61DRAFT_373698, partial [Ilyonectria robusta]|uniref:uncharacterized protein n=1 Tax=Ilyonectria robusta TaxID=1079257 RepID=UPI001E8E333A